MAAKTRRLLTNFSKGELSPLLEGRPDFAGYFEGGKTLENILLLRQGGWTRRPGLRFVAEVKDSSKDTILVPFIFSVSQSYILEYGHQYARFYKNGAQLKVSAGGPAVEIATPYVEADLRDLHFAQSADVRYHFHPTYAQRKLSRVSDTSWFLSTITYGPPPSYEADTDISGGTATLTLGATSGTNVLVTASSAVFLEADVGRQIIIGAGRAVIVSFGASAGDSGSPNDNVRVDILDAFASTGPHAAGTWLLRLSPQATLDPNIKEPVGSQITLVAGKNAFRTADVGKFIKLYGGVIKITARDSPLQVKGIIQSVLGDAVTADPAAAPAGAWTLEEASWSAVRGFPRTGGFHQGRLAQAGTTSQPTTWWLSASDDYDNYAIGTLADNAVEYTMASRQVNEIEWMEDREDLFIGTAGSEHRATGGKVDAPIGGDVIPLVQGVTEEGSQHIQPIVASKRIVFVDGSSKKIFALGYSLEQDGFDTVELTEIADHITGTGIRLGQIAFAKRPHPVIYFIRQDGQLVALTFNPKQKVLGFTRFITDGTFESVAVIPTSSGRDQVWVIVRRIIGGQPKRYVEYFETELPDFRPWRSLQTDSAYFYFGAETTTISGLSHLEGKTVDVVDLGTYIGTKIVSGGQITLDQQSSQFVEIGLHYKSTKVTMRPAVQDEVIEGKSRSWDSVWLRVNDTIGGKINGEQIPGMDASALFSGDVKVTGKDWDTEGRITVEQDQPYPITVLAAFGTLSVGDHD